MKIIDELKTGNILSWQIRVIFLSKVYLAQKIKKISKNSILSILSTKENYNYSKPKLI
jgi:hypothetical protein